MTTIQPAAGAVAGGTRRRPPRFNHVAMSVPAELLGPQGRAELCAFYGDTLGWRELPTETIDHRRLVFGVHTVQQFVFLIADPEPMRCPRLDHFGLSVGTLEELDEILAACRRWQARDPRVDLIDKQVEDHGPLVITNMYVRYLLPMMVEIQHWEFT